MVYNPWPLGNVNPEFHRPELNALRENGYQYNDAREIIGIFERKLAEYAGSKYAVVLDCASNALFLSLKYKKVSGEVAIPRNTYVSVPMQLIHAGCNVLFEDVQWSGIYELGTTGIYDGAARFSSNMYIGGEESLHILSFQIKKRLPIGRGGAILTDSLDAYKWLKLASYDGRDLNTPYDSLDHVKGLGWHMYMTPEDAARGILIFDKLGAGVFPDIAGSQSYPNVEPWILKILESDEQRNGLVKKR
jgi:dTDP-4-amino-4,6-dideoxygalactose transaminase